MIVLMSKLQFKYVIGIDEVGRGPLAGPVAIGAVMMPYKAYIKGYAGTLSLQGKGGGFMDSKKLSSKKRSEWVKFLRNEKREDRLYYCTAFSSAGKIDSLGLTKAITQALEKCLIKLTQKAANREGKSAELTSKDFLLLLDGGLKAPRVFSYQKTIIKGDEKESVIALASIAAKVRRDKYMVQQDMRYPGYYLAEHKGYGTAKHRAQIKKLGLCALHRRSFLKSFTYVEA